VNGLQAPVTRRRVRVWFGKCAIADYRAEPELAERYAAAMARRFASLRVTNDPLPGSPGRPAGER
jgi:hypothetical protein